MMQSLYMYSSVPYPRVSQDCCYGLGSPNFAPLKSEDEKKPFVRVTYHLEIFTVPRPAAPCPPPV